LIIKKRKKKEQEIYDDECKWIFIYNLQNNNKKCVNICGKYTCNQQYLTIILKIIYFYLILLSK
jgi:hypothetical protein